MKSEIFNSLYKILLEHKEIEVNLSQELEIWYDAATEIPEVAVNDFFSKFIHDCGMFHDLLAKSDALGDSHELKLSIVDGHVLMAGKTRNESDLYLDEDQEGVEELEEISFKWIFDKKGNVILIE